MEVFRVLWRFLWRFSFGIPGIRSTRDEVLHIPPECSRIKPRDFEDFSIRTFLLRSGCKRHNRRISDVTTY